MKFKFEVKLPEGYDNRTEVIITAQAGGGLDKILFCHPDLPPLLYDGLAKEIKEISLAWE